MKVRGTTACLRACGFGTAVLALFGVAPASAADAGLRAGAAQVDVSPRTLPVIVNGGFIEQKSDKVRDRLHARAVVLDDATTRLAIVVVDSCMMPRELIDRAKRLAHERTGIPEDRMLIAATHTHSAPSCMGALGAGADREYAARLPERIADAVVRAHANVAPAQVGWTVVNDDAHTHCRRWIRRPDRLLADPFGDRTVRANMHPGYLSPDVVGPSGPVDPGLSIVLFRSPSGRPIALLANYSMHYFGTPAVSADYFGRFASTVARKLGGDDGENPCVAIMSQGTSGDQHWMDYGAAKTDLTIDRYADAIADEVVEACRKIELRSTASLAMAESRITLRRRAPDEKRLAWARPIVAAMGDRVPRNQPEVYAKEAVYLHDEPERELKLQAIRIGELAIAAIPDEVYALSGLRIKARSPLPATFVMELANGSEGYIPPPEQHVLGGYTTWPARTAALEVGAEPRIVDNVVALLEKVADRPQRTPAPPKVAYADAVLRSKPTAYWRLAEMTGRDAADATGQGHRASLVGGYALYLEGPSLPGFASDTTRNRAVHLAGGRLTSPALRLGRRYTVEFWFWNGLPDDARPLTGILWSETARDGGLQLAVAGREGRASLTHRGTKTTESGSARIAPRTWCHAAVVRDAERVTVHIDGRPDVSFTVPGEDVPETRVFHIGGAEGQTESLEGRVDEVAVYDRALDGAEIRARRAAADRQAR